MLSRACSTVMRSMGGRPRARVASTIFCIWGSRGIGVSLGWASRGGRGPPGIEDRMIDTPRPARKHQLECRHREPDPARTAEPRAQLVHARRRLRDLHHQRRAPALVPGLPRCLPRELPLDPLPRLPPLLRLPPPARPPPPPHPPPPPP